MLFSNLELSQRLERAEGYAAVRFAEARRRVFPESGAEWIECGGAQAIFDGVDSPVTQTFGLGLFEPVTPATLDKLEAFFHDHGAPVLHEVSPFAGIAALDLLCARDYRPLEICNVLYCEVALPDAQLPVGVTVRCTGPSEAELWSAISARGWTHEHPELLGFAKKAGAISAAREQSPAFLAEVDGRPGAAGVLCLHEGVALFAGASTIPELRRRGLQSALLDERMRYAADHGCDLAMMVAEAGSNSQCNAERKGFRVAYTRVKWKMGALGSFGQPVAHVS